MKTTLLTFILSVFFILDSPALSNAASISLPIVKETTVEPVTKKEKAQSFKSIRQSAEKKLGRKLKLSERIALRYYTHIPGYDNDYKRRANNQALTGFVLGICALVLFPLLAIPGFILSNAALTKEKLDPGILEGGNRGLAKAGQILSIIGFLYIILIVVYIIAIINTSFFWF